jgi:trigger factor
VEVDIDLVLKEVEPCEWRADVTVPRALVDREFDAAAEEIRRVVSIPGFRMGKAPAALVAKRFGGDIQSQVMQNIHSAAFEKIKNECEVDLVTLPLPKDTPPAPMSGAAYSMTLLFDAAPKFDLPDYKNIKIPEPDMKDVDKEVDAELERYRDVYAEFASVEEPAKREDMLQISLSSDIALPEGAPEATARLLNADETWCWINEPEMLPGMIEALEGAKKGDKKKLEVEFPDDFVEPSLVGLKGTYEITVLEVRRRIPLDDDDALCAKLGVDNMDKLKERLEESVVKKRRVAGRRDAVTTIFETFRKKAGDFPLPPSMLSQSTRSELRSIANAVVRSQDDLEAFQKDMDAHKAAAEKTAEGRLRDFFISKAIAKLENIEVGQHDMDNRIRAMSSLYGRSEKELRKQLEDSGAMEDIHIDMTIEKVADRILELNQPKRKKKNEKEG